MSLRQDWVRTADWNVDDQREFRTRLARVRKKNRAAHLIAKAEVLKMTAVPSKVEGALALLDDAQVAGIDEFVLASWYQCRGDCLFVLDKDDAAVAEYKKAFDALRAFRGIRRLAYLDFAWIIAVKRLSSYVDEALDVIEEFADKMDFVWSLNTYSYFGALALFSDMNGEHEIARQWAVKSLGALADSQTPQKDHESIRLRKFRGLETYHFLQKLAAT